MCQGKLTVHQHFSFVPGPFDDCAPVMKNEPFKILLIEDDPDDFVLIRNLLSQIPFSGYELGWVTTGRQALDLIRSDRFDACLLDYRLGEEDGIAVLRSLIEAGCKAPVIFLAGCEDHWVDIEAMRAGATDYQVKGEIDAKILERSIRYSIRQKKYEEELAGKNSELTRALEELKTKDEELRARHRELARAKKLAEVERRRYQSLFDYAPDAYLVTDTRGTIKAANRAAAALLGVDCAQLPEKPLSRFVSEEYRSLFSRDLAALTPADGPKRYEITLAPGRGGPMWVSISITAEKLNDELNIRWLIRDIDKRKAADDALRRSKELFEKTFISQLAAILILDDAIPPRIIDCNPAATRMFGYSREEMIGLTTGFLYSDFEAARSFGEAFINAVGESGFVYRCPFQMKRRDGALFPTERSVVPLMDKDGRRFGWVSVAHDITERMKTEAALRKSKELFEKTFAGQLNAIFILDNGPTPGIVDCNPAAEAMFGYGRDEMIGRPVAMLHCDETDLAGLRDTVLEAVTDSGFFFIPEFRMKRKNGGLFPTEHSVVPLLDNGGERFGWVVVVDDITERVEAERAVKEGAERIKQFAYSIYHDLKNPAIALRWFADRLSGGYGPLLDEKGRGYCDRVLRISEEIVLFVDRINQYISTKEASLCIETVDVNEVLRLIGEEFFQKMQAGAIRWLVPERPIRIRADRVCLVRALRNFVENALKYGGEKLREISVEYTQSEQFHTISLKDDGNGLQGEEFDKIFEIFQRGRSSRGVPGAGLGLGIVKEIAEQHGGKVWAESRPEGGVVFHLSLSRSL